MKDKENKSSEVDLQFEKMIRSVMEEQGYFKTEDVKPLMEEILKSIEPIIAKHVKEHIFQICNHVAEQLLPQIKGEKEDAETT